MALERYQIFNKIDTNKFSTIIAETYYKIIKELLSAKCYEIGIKTFGENAHKDLLKFSRKQNLITGNEFELIDDLRKRRNKSSYQGIKIPSEYIELNKKDFEKLINKLK
jgi:hypothetical protein